MRTYKAEGIVIKRRDFGEADRYITLFTKEHGKISVKALGVRKLTSTRSPHVELLSHCFFSLYRTQTNPILTEVKSVDSFELVKGDLTKIGFAYHICELVDGLCAEHQENEAIFSLLLETLGRLCSNENIAVVVHQFEIELLRQLGFWPKEQKLQGKEIPVVIERILERKLRSLRLLPRFRN